MDESTMWALVSIVGYVDKIKLYKVFEKDVMHLLDLKFKIQEKQSSKFSIMFATFYNMLFDRYFEINNITQTKRKSTN
jgi:hypothetical protein